MNRVKAGYLGALSILFERYQSPIYNFFLRMGSDREESMDLTQSTFERVLKYRKSFRDDHRFRSWVYKLARNHAYDLYRRKRSRPESPMDPEHAESIPSVLDLHSNPDQRNFELKDALEQLKTNDRELILMHKFQGLSYQEISEVLGAPEGKLRTQMHRAMLRLKEVFYEERSIA